MNKNSYDGKIAGLYDLEDTLGRGHFAVVKLARHVFTGEKVAVKVIDKTKLDEVSRSHLFQEVRCMKLVQHPNVVRLYEVIDTQTKLYLILEWGDGGDMYDYIMKHEKGLNEETAKKYFRQIVHAISYCHKLHVVHRDLKPENVVFFEKLGMVKLTDFGFSNRFFPGQKLETSCGSLAYSAPEILLGDSYDAPAVDVWSLGVILFMLVCGQAPFQEANDSETLTMIMDCKYTIPSYVSPECTRLIQKMLIRDPEKRSTIEEITNDLWLQSSTTVQYADHLPLVSREHLSEEDHSHIIQKMVNGNIATQEEITEALENNVYCHITATYFLLAERKLRALRQERAKLLNATHESDLSALAISPRNPSIPGCPSTEVSLPRTVDGLLSPQESRRATQASVPFPVDALDACSNWVPQRKDEVTKLLSAGSENVGSDEKSGRKPTVRLLTNHDSECVNVQVCNESGVQENGAGTNSKEEGSKSCTDVFSVAKNKFKAGNGPNNRKLHSVRSSPQLTLNEIYEEVESDGEPTSATNFLPSGGSNSTISSPSTRVLKTHQSVASPTILRKYEQRRRFVKARTASCSSSDASDDDTETRKRKAEKLKRIPGWRDRKNRDDDDESDQERGGPGVGGSSVGNNSAGGQTANGKDQSGGAKDSNGDSNTKGNTGGNQSYSSSPKRQAPLEVEVSRAGSEELLTTASRNKSVLLQICHVVKSADELCPNNRHIRFNKTPSPILAHVRSQGSVTHNLMKTSAASPPPSPLSTPNVTSLRQSKTLNQLNRFISPPSSMLGSPVLDIIGDKENHVLSRHCARPLQLLNFKRPGKWRPPSYPQGNSLSSASTIAAGSNGLFSNSSLPTSNNQVVAATASESSLAPTAAAGRTSSRYRLGLYRLLKHAPHLASSNNGSSNNSGSSNGGVTKKRWDINRNGFAGSGHPVQNVANTRSNSYGVDPYRVASTPTSSPSHSKCCSLC